MGRRALPRMDAAVDSSGHFLEQKQLAPWRPEVWFGRSAPLEFEVGSGKGLFLRTQGAANPDRLYLGVELADRYARWAAYRAAQAGLPNVRAVSGNAVEVLDQMVPEGALDAVHVYFPDPWWKARHRKRRVLNEVLARAVVRALPPGGRLHFWTDVEEYYLATLELLAEHAPLLDGPFPVEEKPAEGPLDYRTHRERRVRMAGAPVYRSEFVRKPGAAPARIAPAEDEDDPA